MKKIIGQFDKRVDEVVIIKINSFKGVNYIDTRAYRKPIFPDKEPRHTHKGLKLKCELIPRIIEILKKAEEFKNQKQEEKN